MSGYYDLYIQKSGEVQLNLQEKTVIPLALGNIITADEPYNGLSKVIIPTEPNLIPANIKFGKNIYGVIGSYITTVDVRPLTFDPIYNGKTLTPSGFDGYSSIVQNPIENLNTSNVKKGVTIAGITGKYTKHEWYDNLTVIPDYFFKNNSNITEWEAPYQCIEIGEQAIYNCESLENIEINLKNEGIILGGKCFANNPNLIEITFNNTTFVSETYDYLTNNPKLSTIVVPVDWNTNIDLTGCDSISEESLEDLIYKLKDLSGEDAKYIITGDENYSKIEPHLFDLANDKNWVIEEKAF